MAIGEDPSGARGTREAIHGRVLVVDSDYDTLGALSRALRGRGHNVVLAADGRAGLQRAVEIAPDVVLVDQELPVLDVRTFLEVLRDNPRTGAAHAFVMGRGDPARLSALDARAEPLLKPFNAEEVAARVDEVLRARLGPKREPMLHGDLEQVAMFDLFQVFAANRRTGCLRIEGALATGEVFVSDGRIVDAVYGGATGEKALYRMLAVARGRFVFAPGVEPEVTRIDLPTDHLLMEGARRNDEIARLRETLPPFDALVRPGVPFVDATPLETSILGNLDEPRAIEELLDLSFANDLEVLRSLASLIERGAAVVFDPRGQRVRIVDPVDAVVVRAAIARLRRPGLAGRARLGVVSSTATDIARFARALGSVEEFVAAAHAPVDAGGGALGVLGSVRIEGTDLELFALPNDHPLRPLWGPLLSSARTVLWLDADAPDDEAAALLRALEINAVRVAEGWERPQGAAEAIRAALAHATPKTPPPR